MVERGVHRGGQGDRVDAGDPPGGAEAGQGQVRHEGGGGLRLPAGVDAYTYNPGFVPGTGLFRDTDPVSRADGGAYIDKGRVIPSSAESYDVEREEDLWRTADALCGVTTG